MGKLKIMKKSVGIIAKKRSNMSLDVGLRRSWSMGGWYRAARVKGGVEIQQWTGKDVFLTIFNKMQLKTILQNRKPL